MFRVEVFHILLALVLIYFGVRVLTGWKPRSGMDGTSPSTENTLNEVLVMSSYQKAVSSDSFRGGKIVLIFSGGELDLSRAKMNERATLEITGIFSGLKLIVPSGWRVESQGTTFAGGYDNRAVSGGGPTLTVTGSLVFSGLEIVSV